MSGFTDEQGKELRRMQLETQSRIAALSMVITLLVKALKESNRGQLDSFLRVLGGMVKDAGDKTDPFSFTIKDIHSELVKALK